MELARNVIEQEAANLHQQNVRIRHLGRMDRLDPSLQGAINRALDLTADNTGLTLSMAFDYGGRAEIVEAVQRIIQEGVPRHHVDETLLSRYLYTADLPDPDLVIRTGGEQRLSNFLLWQAAYAEYYYTTSLWPDFNEREVEKALEAYRQRHRRFGGCPPDA